MGQRGDVEAELTKITEIVEKGNSLIEQLMPRRKNVAAVRGWRLNIQANMRRLSEPQEERLTEDEYNVLADRKEQFNAVVSALNMDISSEHDLRMWDSAVAMYKSQRETLKYTRGFDIQKAWQQELATIEKQIKVAEKTVRERSESKRFSLTNVNLEELKAETGAKRYLVVKENQYTHRVYVDVRPWEDVLGYLNNAFTLWDELVQDYQSGTIEDVERDVRVAKSRIASEYGGTIANAIAEHCYFPGSPYSRRLENTVPREQFRNEIMNFFKREAEKITSELAQQKTEETSPLRTKITGSLSTPGAKGISSNTRLPQSVRERLTELMRGPYAITIDAASEINEYAQQYGTLPLKINQEQMPDYDDLIQTAKQLEDLMTGFSGEFNSSRGQMVVGELQEAAEKVIALKGYKERRVSSVLSEFQTAGNDLQDWIQDCWYQFGGQPSNHKSAGSGDSSQVTHKAHIGTIKSTYTPKD